MDTSFVKVLKILHELKAARISSEIKYIRDDSLQIAAYVPGQHWEIDVYKDGTIEFEVFQSCGEVQNEDALAAAIRLFTD